MKLKIYNPHKWSKSRNKDRGFGSYTVYYKNHSIDVYGVYSPKAAIRKVLNMIKKEDL